MGFMAATVQATCPGCRNVLRIPADWADRALKCKKCGAVVRATRKAPTPPPVPVTATATAPAVAQTAPAPALPANPAYPPSGQPGAYAPGSPVGYPYPYPPPPGYAYPPPPGYPYPSPGYGYPPPGAFPVPYAAAA